MRLGILKETTLIENYIFNFTFIHYKLQKHTIRGYLYGYNDRRGLWKIKK